MAANPSGPALTSQVDTNALTPALNADAPDRLYPPTGPAPPGTHSSEVARTEREETAHPDEGMGIEGEDVVWEARYSLRNFLGRIAGRVVLTLVWAGLAIDAWGLGHQRVPNWVIVALGIGLGVLWLTLLYRIALARFGHYYQLTTRRLLVSTGVLNRRKDQLELLRVEDVYTRQSLFERWLALGSVVVVSSEPSLPSLALPGVEEPKRVMDLIWHHARSERDQRSVKVQEI